VGQQDQSLTRVPLAIVSHGAGVMGAACASPYSGRPVTFGCAEKNCRVNSEILPSSERLSQRRTHA
jgi:hypothetical protein